MFVFHNFWTRKARKPIKGSKDSDFNLVSTASLSEMHPLFDWALGGPIDLSQEGRNLPHNVTHKKMKPKTHNFSLQTRRLAKSFESLNSSLVQSTGELWNAKRKPPGSKCVKSNFNKKGSINGYYPNYNSTFTLLHIACIFISFHCCNHTNIQ